MTPMKCTVCNGAWALKIPDPDGGRRCIAHSTSDTSIARRAAAAATGKAAGERQRGVSADRRADAVAGVFNLETERNKHAEAKVAARMAKKEHVAIPLDSKVAVLAFLGRVAGELMDGGEAGVATAASALARAALTAMGVEDKVNPEDEVTGFRVVRVDRMSHGKLDA